MQEPSGRAPSDASGAQRPGDPTVIGHPYPSTGILLVGAGCVPSVYLPRRSPAR